MVHGKRADMIVHEVEPYNAEPPRVALAGQPLTALDTFYSRNHGVVPCIDPRTWRLRVDGLVGQPLDLTLAQLRDRFIEHSVVATLQCAGNRRKGFLAVRDIPGEAPWGPAATSTAAWSGVRLSDVLAAAGLAPEAAHIEFAAPDLALDATPPQAYGGSIPVVKAKAGEVLLAWSMNGQALPAEHGAPVRIVVPGYIGARSVKWVSRITALGSPSENYFHAVAYRLPVMPFEAGSSAEGGDRALGPVLLTSDILSHDESDFVVAGPITVRGYALAGDGHNVSGVDVSVDGGRSWQPADLDRELGPWAWRQWSLAVELPAGPAQIQVRARDTSGVRQPESAEQLWNPKGYMNNSWARVRVTATAG